MIGRVGATNLDTKTLRLDTVTVMRASENAPSTRQAIETPSAWRGGDLATRRDWIWALTANDVAELSAAADVARGIALDSLTPNSFPLPTLSQRITAAAQELRSGLGFVLLRGLPLADFGEDEIATIYCGIGAHLGINVSQSAEGDRLGHVINRGGTDRYYTRGGELEFHMDPVDVVGLLCLHAAVKGGASRIASAMTIHNIMLEEEPALLEILYRGFRNSLRGHGEDAVSDPVPTYAATDTAIGTAIECYHLPITIRQAAADGYPLSAGEQAALDCLAAVAARPDVYLDMEFREGDIQFLNNRLMLHARTDYVDSPEPDLKRHLLRLWLMMGDWPDRAAVQRFHKSGDRAGGGIKPRARGAVSSTP